MMMTEDCSRFDAGQARLLSPGGHLCLSNTIRILETQTPEYLAGAGTHTHELSPPIVRGWFGGTDYMPELVLPDFLFRISDAYPPKRQESILDRNCDISIQRSR
jgi:hypothetical protein